MRLSVLKCMLKWDLSTSNQYLIFKKNYIMRQGLKICYFSLYMNSSWFTIWMTKTLPPTPALHPPSPQELKIDFIIGPFLFVYDTTSIWFKKCNTGRDLSVSHVIYANSVSIKYINRSKVNDLKCTVYHNLLVNLTYTLYLTGSRPHASINILPTKLLNL